MIKQNEIDELVNRIVSYIHPQRIVLFGSYATGNADEGSDLDLLILGETDKPMTHRTRDILQLTRGMKIPVDIVMYTQSEVDKWGSIPNSFLYDVIRKGKTLYEQ